MSFNAKFFLNFIFYFEIFLIFFFYFFLFLQSLKAKECKCQCFNLFINNLLIFLMMKFIYYCYYFILFYYLFICLLFYYVHFFNFFFFPAIAANCNNFKDAGHDNNDTCMESCSRMAQGNLYYLLLQFNHFLFNNIIYLFFCNRN